MGDTLKEFWESNKKSYLISSIIASILGSLIYIVRVSPKERVISHLFLIVVFCFVGAFVLMLGGFLLINKKNE